MACWPRRSRYPDDFSWVKYRLRKEARWHDGKPVTPEDVIFSLEVLKKYSPMYASYYRHVAKAEKTGEREITFTFDCAGKPRTADHRRRTHGAAEALVGRHRQRRQASATSPRPRWRRRWAPALTGSRNSSPARSVALERVKDYWGAESAGADRPEQFRRAAFRVLPRQYWSRWKPSRPIRPTGSPRTQRQALGDRL